MDYKGRWIASVTQDELVHLDPVLNEGRAIDLDGHHAVLAFHSTLTSRQYRSRNVGCLDPEGPLNWLSLIAGVICATVCAVRVSRTPLAARPAPRHFGADVPLTDAEFERAYQCSSWVKLAAHGTDFVRGFLVGALAPSDPAL